MLTLWKTVFIASSCVCFSSFAWAIRSHFSNTDQPIKSIGMRAITILGILSFVAEVAAIAVSLDGNFATRSMALILYAGSLVIFWSAVKATKTHRLTLAFTDDEPVFLIQTGPYRYVRHPFYLAYSLFWLAGVFAANSWYPVFIPAVMISLYLAAAVSEERKFASSEEFAAQYREYKSRTGLVLPKIF